MNEFLAIGNSTTIATHGPIDRPALLSEYLPDQPLLLLQEVFSTRSHSDLLKELLAACINRVTANQHSPDADCKLPAPIAEFYNALPSLIESLDAIGKKASLPEHHLQTVRNFCGSYSLTFVRRELWCFLNAVAKYGNDNAASIPVDIVLDWFEQLCSLIETAYVLDARQLNQN